ncbi:Signal transduction histidine kinase [Actinokineospora iranica]|uniref:histidine kinase n=1 Tax=Actinokineospora iranica TaxID=1271860 RepID=A0A1G6M3Q9_9PSEU|nr:Signal transduction histidine kinase [Actinokineospora iranica]
MTWRRPWRSPVWHAVLTFGLGCVLFAVDFPLVGHGGLLPGPDWARVLVLGGMSLLQLGRERAAVPALVAALPLWAVDAAMGVSLPVLLVAGDQLYAAVLNGSRRSSQVLVVLAGVFMVGTLVAALVLADDLRTSLLIFLGVCPLPLVPVWWALNVRQQREIAEAERARADQLARIAELDREAAVNAERASMARDLHDVIAGHLSAIAIQSEALLSLQDGDPETVRTVLRSVRENSVASLTEMRAMIGLLRAQDGHDELTSPARLRELDRLLRSARASGLRVRADTDVPADLPAAVDLSAYRILQEALTNAAKHAPGAAADVSVRQADRTLVVQVVNDGAGGALNASGTGLITMTERAQAVGGVLLAGPCERGWRVRAELPVEGE